MAHLFSSLRSALMPLVMKTRGAPAYMLHIKLIPLGGNMQLNTCACDDMCVNRKHIYIYISLMGYGQLYQGGAARYAYNIRPPNYLRNCTVSEVIQVGRC